MRIVDTSVWIEWLVASSLGKQLAREIPEKTQCVVPTNVQLELAKWLTREVGEDAADQMIAYTQKCVVAPLDTRIALHAADLLTCDAHLKICRAWCLSGRQVAEMKNRLQPLLPFDICKM